MSCDDNTTGTNLCCDHAEAITPLSVENRPGLDSLVYRVGTHARFKTAMLRALSKSPTLRRLTTREESDPSIALIDAWATVLDVLAFYQERIANESYLRCASEARSVLELAESIGYEARPGVAASTYLHFEMESAQGAPTSATIEKGTKAQSLPGQNETPQVFETVEEIEAQLCWNLMRPKRFAHSYPSFGEQTLYLAGVNTGLSEGDALLLVGQERIQDPGNENWDFRLVVNVHTDRESNTTIVTLNKKLGSQIPLVKPAAKPAVYALRRRAALFGHNAPDWRAMPDEVRGNYQTNTALDDWPDLSISKIAKGMPDTIYLDKVYPGVVPGSWITLVTPDYVEVYSVTSVAESSRTNFALSSKSTRLTIEGEHLTKHFDNSVRDVVVHCESELLEQADRPIPDPVGGNTIILDRNIVFLEEGRLLIVTGVDIVSKDTVSEVMTLKRCDSWEGTTRLTFTDSLTHSYIRDSVEIRANIARATHGESKSETLGSGDASKSFQRFTLKHNPLTWTSAPTPSGVESTLELRVDNVLWEGARSLYGLGNAEHAYIIRRHSDGASSVQFGNGINGARLPSGVENITASYRQGIGLAGMVKEKQIRLLLTRPLGVKSAENPLPPTGAADPETSNEIRTNAPLTVLTLDRIVSLRDVEDFANAFPGIGKAMTTQLWSGERRVIHLSIAAVDGDAVPQTSDLFNNLRAAIDQARHVDEQLLVDSYESLRFSLEAGLFINKRFIIEHVLQAVRDTLERAFSFTTRAFGQAVTVAEVIATMQSVEGVTAVDIDKFHGLDPFVVSRLPAFIARWDGGVIRPAQLWTIDTGGIVLKIKE